MIRQVLTEHIQAALSKAGIVSPRVELEHPANESFGDWSSNVALQYVKAVEGFKNPREFAASLQKTLQTKLASVQEIEEVSVAGPGFINFRLSEKHWCNRLEEMKTPQAVERDIPQTGKGKKVIVEYSSPNIAKPFTVGHLRSTIIGDALARLLEATGWTVYRDNHVGDWGTQFGKLVYAIETWGDKETIARSERPIKELVRLYVLFHEKAEKDPSIEDAGRAWFKRLEEGDEHARKLWQWCVDLSWQEFDKIYQQLGVSFTENNGRGYGESFFESKMAKVLALMETQLSEEKAEQNGGYYGTGKDGAKLVFFNDDSLPPLMILKKDGATLYSTRDLATDYFRLQHYDKPDLIVNEVGAEQNLYFRQIYKVEEMLGWYKPQQRVHVRHGLYRFKDGKMATRKGNVIWLEDVIQEAVDRATALAKNESVKSSVIALGALKWNDLKSEPTRDIIFDWDEILSMKGNSGPYVQYAAVRAKSILAKTTLSFEEALEDIAFNAEELAVIKHLDRFGETVEKAAAEFLPHHVALFLLELAQRFNLFYNQHPILEAKTPQLQRARLQLTFAVHNTLVYGLQLLGIETPETM